LIDPAGTVRLQHVSADPHDRPTVDSILEKINVGQSVLGGFGIGSKFDIRN
jgi:hypothetical protein